MTPEGNPAAGEVKEGVVDGEQVLMTHQQSAELSQPGMDMLHDSSALVASEFASILVTLLLVVLRYANPSRFMTRLVSLVLA